MSAQASAKTRPPVIVVPLRRGAILSGQRSEGPSLDLLDATRAGDRAAARRLRIGRSRPLAVVLDERPRLRAVDLEPLANGVLAIVIALHQRLAGKGVASLDLRRIELHVGGA